MERYADQYFDKSISERERAIFEVGIKLGAIYHQFVGTPISHHSADIETLEKGIAKAIEAQPYVKKVQIQIHLPESETLTEGTKSTKQHPFDYGSVNPKNLHTHVELEYKSWRVIGKMEWIEELNYPLMYIHSILKKME